MLKTETYKEKLRKLEEKYKDNKNAEYFKERVGLLVNDLTPYFPRDIAIHINCISIDLTEGKGIYKYPKEVKDYFYTRGNNGEIGPTFRFDRDLEKESSYKADIKCINHNVNIEDFQYLLKELNKLEKAAISLKIFKRSKHWTFRKPIQYFIDKAKSKCFEHIEKLSLPDNNEEMKVYCDYFVKGQGKYNANDYNFLDIFECKSDYTDQLILLCSPIVCDAEGKLLKLEQKRHITKLKKFSWEYYQYTFEYLRNYFSSYSKEYFDYVEEIYDRILEDFTQLSTFFITRGICRIYDYNLGSIKLSPGFYFQYDNSDYFDEDFEKAKIEHINFIRYFWYNLTYVYNSIYSNDIFTDAQKKYVYRYMQNTLNDISELIHCEGWI